MSISQIMIISFLPVKDQHKCGLLQHSTSTEPDATDKIYPFLRFTVAGMLL